MLALLTHLCGLTANQYVALLVWPSGFLISCVGSLYTKSYVLFLHPKLYMKLGYKLCSRKWKSLTASVLDSPAKPSLCPCPIPFSLPKIPAPKRGEIVRQIGDALRQKIKVLGSLVRPPLESLISHSYVVCVCFRTFIRTVLMSDIRTKKKIGV